jgi:hypothetical protein
MYVTEDASFSPSQFIEGELGAPRLNSSLSDPLTNGGDFCREYRVPTTVTNGAWGEYTVIDSVDGGIYTGPFSTSKAYSMRAWMRNDAEFNNCQASMIGLCIRTTSGSTGIKDDGNPARIRPGGYTVQLSGRRQNLGTDSTEIHLYLGANYGGDNAATVDGADHSSFPPIACSGGITAVPANGPIYARNTWHRVRFDLVPVGNAGDTLNVYTSSAGDVPSGQEVWELVGTRFIASSDPVYYEPTTTTASMGWFALHNDNDVNNDLGSVYIDQLEILVKDL